MMTNTNKVLKAAAEFADVLTKLNTATAALAAGRKAAGRSAIKARKLGLGSLENHVANIATPALELRVELFVEAAVEAAHAHNLTVEAETSGPVDFLELLFGDEVSQ